MTGAPWYTARGVVASGALLAVLALIGVALAFTGGERGSTSRTARTVQPTDTAGSVCGLPAGSQDPVVGAPEASWALVGATAVPAAHDVGPGITGPRTRRCFGHGPTGALFAAVNFVALALRYPNDRDVALQVTARTRARDVFLEQQDPPADPQFRVEVSGFRMRVIDRDHVNVDLAFQTNREGAIVSMVLPMRWEDGDWRAVITSLEEPYVTRRLPGLLGYVHWGAT